MTVLVKEQLARQGENQDMGDMAAHVSMSLKRWSNSSKTTQILERINMGKSFRLGLTGYLPG